MGRGDACSLSLARCIVGAVGSGEETTLAQHPALQAFAEDAGCSILRASLTKDRQVDVANDIKAPSSALHTIYLAKVAPEPLTVDTIASRVTLSSIPSSSPLLALHNALHNVFGPLLTGQQQHVHKLLTELEAGLGVAIRKQDAAEDGPRSIYDEYTFWVDRAATSPERQYAAEVSSMLQPIAQGFQTIWNMSPEDVLELQRSLQDALDAIWRSPAGKFPQTRMAHLFHMAGSDFALYVRKKVSALSVWTDPFKKVEEVMVYGVRLCREWLQILENLTSHVWVAWTEHPWKGGPHSDPMLQGLTKTLDEVLSIRTVHEELFHLLSVDEQRELRVEEAFRPFRRLKLELGGELTAHASWKAAREEYERNIQRIEHATADKLRARFEGVLIPFMQEALASRNSPQPHQVVQELYRFRGLLRRPNIRQALEREQTELLGLIKRFMRGMKGELEEPPSPGWNLPHAVNHLAQLTKASTKVQEYVSIIEDALGDLSSPMTSEATTLLRDMRKVRDEGFRSWILEIRKRMKDASNPLGLKVDEIVMAIDYSDGKMRVQFHDELLTLLREVRQMSAMGLHVPEDIKSVAKVAQQFYQYGVVLKQVACFHNTVGAKIVPSQQPLMKESAKEFESLVTDERAVVTWNQQSKLEGYVHRLQVATEKFSAENNKLRKIHILLTEKVLRLFEVDLLKSRDKWKEVLAEIRGVLASVENQGYNSKSTRLWRRHWDHQLYKVLEYQYRRGLLCSREILPITEIRLVFKMRALQFEPPMEEIRANYYKELRKFITVPLNFRGVGDSPFFKNMIPNNADSLAVVFQQAESTFCRLLDEQKKYLHWVVLGTVDIDDFVEKNVQELRDFDHNLKMLKSRARDVEHLPDSVMIDCFKISLIQLKTTVDDQMQTLADSLVRHLRKSVVHDIETVGQFLTKSMARLGVRPQNLDQIAEVKRASKEISRDKRSMRSIIAIVDDKNKLLKATHGSGIPVAGLASRWEQLELTLEAHDTMLGDEFQRLRVELEKRIGDMQNELADFIARWNELKPKDLTTLDIHASKDICEKVKEWRREFDKLLEASKGITADCDQFDIPAPAFHGLTETEEDITRVEEGWLLLEQYSAALDKFGSQGWITFRSKTSTFDDFIQEWLEKLRARKSDTITLHIKHELDLFRKMMPGLTCLKGEGMTSDHWSMIFHLLQIPKSTTIESLTFGLLLGAAKLLTERLQQLKDIHERAKGERTIREALQELAFWAEDTRFTLVEHTNNGRTTPLIREWKDAMTQVGDNQALLQSLKESRYFVPFTDEVNGWETKLTLLDECLRGLNLVQRKWVYLEPIFARGALPQEQGRFKMVDEEYRGIMLSVQNDSRVICLVETNRRKELHKTLTTLVDQLERCQKALNQYLEDKRSRFSRFYFIGDDDLLEILGQPQNPTVIGAHLKKLFAGIHAVRFSDDNDAILSMISSEGENVPLRSPVLVTDRVEEWMTDLDEEMKRTLKGLLLQCYEDPDPDNASYPSQILCLVEQIRFTVSCETAIQNGKLSIFRKQLKQRLADITLAQSRADHVLGLKLKALILDLIRGIDMVESLMDAHVKTVRDWLWTKQLRFHFNDSSDVVVRMFEYETPYTYEYQGNAPKLVHTPLTDKCYLTLTQGMHLGYGGNPYGPAGTGKTESVKQLGGLLGRHVLVFNCDEGIDFRGMGRIFAGIVKCGAWGCFDEFNRLEEDVLSAISQQIQSIQGAIKEKQAEIELLGSRIEVNPNSGIFVTLNPAGKGYGGRSKLPDNLKQLFRPVAMTAPDNVQIAEVLLFAEGFRHAKILAGKLVTFFTLARQLMSAQQHYDWGLRALKTVLRVSGRLVQKERQQERELSIKEEQQFAIKALRVNTLSKLTHEDSKRFHSLVSDVFPGIPVLDIAYEELEGSVKAALNDLHLEAVDTQIQKVLQLYEACTQRIGVVIVGPSGSGKSTLLKVLRLGLERLGQTIRVHVMNPKAMSRQMLLGNMDLDTREWFDGVLTVSARQVVKEPLTTHSWIICDGDVDPEWIESLNSVLDDNHLMTLPSGERIQFGNNVNFIFETHDLKFASPATISRMGMIFLSDKDLRVETLVVAYVHRQPEALREHLTLWFQQLFHRGLDWVMKVAERLPVTTTRGGLIANALSHVRGASSKAEFVYGLVRGLGADLYQEDRLKLAHELFLRAKDVPVDQRRPLDCVMDGTTYRLLMGDAGTTLSYQQLCDTQRGLDPPTVLTVGIQRITAILEPWITAMEPVLLVGPSGCGKSLVLRHCFSKLKSATVTAVYCSAQTNAVQLIKQLEAACSTHSTTEGRVLRPKDSERMILYLKDVNLAKPDKYDTMQIVAFLHQLISFGGFYNLDKEWIGIDRKRIQIVLSMGPPTSFGRHDLSPRLAGILRICYMEYPDSEELQGIIASFLRPVAEHMGDAKWRSESALREMATGMVDLYTALKEKLTTDQENHYIFTPRDLVSWCINLLRYSTTNSDMLTVWVYEACRIFRDRLVGTEALALFDGSLSHILRSRWNAGFPDVNTLLFTSLVATDAMLYQTALDDFQKIVEKGLHVHERDIRKLGLVLFREPLSHITRVERALLSPGGSLLLVGRTGVGRRSIASLGSSMLGLEFRSPHITRGYSSKDFANFLKDAIQEAGVKGQKLVVFLEDFQLCDPSYLEMINSLLSAGEVPGLFAAEELEAALVPLKDILSSEGDMHQTPYHFFLSRVKANLHIILSMDPTDPGFTARCESTPSLFSRCSIQWLGTWSSEMQEAVVNAKLSHIRSDLPGTELLDYVLHVHRSCLSLNVTPRDFVQFLDTYVALYESRKTTQQDKQGHLRAGLGKLEEAEREVKKLSDSAETQKVKLARKQKEADAALARITKSMGEASEQKKEAEVLKEKLAEEEGKLSERQKQIEAELADVQPLIDESRAAVGRIRSQDLSEIRSLPMPPDAIRDVLEGVLRLLGNQDTSWVAIKRFLGSKGVREEIMNFDTEKVTPAIRASVEAHLAEKASSFDPERIRHVSVAAAPLAAWVQANLRFTSVLQNIAPLRNEMKTLATSRQLSCEKLRACEMRIKQLDDDVVRLREDFAQRTGEAEALKISLEKATSTLQSARTLLDKLLGEKGRWEEQVAGFAEMNARFPYSMLLSAGFITYLGGTPESVRRSLTQDWIRCCESFEFTAAMSTESQLLAWKSEGLSGDELTMENALIVLHSSTFPLIIDPARKATEWLKNHFSSIEGKTVEVTRYHDPRFANTLDLSVRFGKTLVVEDVDVIEPILYPILRRELEHQGSRMVTYIGEKAVDWHESFQLILITRNASPLIPPDAQALVNSVNFTVTRSGLESQLLSITMHHERPELEQKKAGLLKQEEELKVQLDELERRLLDELGASQGNLLENTVLLESLNNTKVKSVTIAESLHTSRSLQRSLDEQRNVYRPLAQLASSVFFLVSDLVKLNNMYQFSLGSFLKLFMNTLQEKGDSTSVSSRIKTLSTCLLSNTFSSVNRSLFKADRIGFALHLVHGIHPELFGEKEWEILTGTLVVSNITSSNIPSWVPIDRKDRFLRLQTTFSRLSNTLNFSNGSFWSAWIRNLRCETQLDNVSITPFQRVLVLHALRPDRLQHALHSFVTSALEMDVLALSSFSLHGLSKETAPTEPILLIATAGADPSQELEELAVREVGRNRFRQVAMGQGQTSLAEEMLNEAARSGEWLCIKNLHLVTWWLPTLEKHLNVLQPHPAFRLWLTTEAHPKFTPALLQNSVKVTIEAPPGVRNNILRTFEAWPVEWFGGSQTRRAHLLFVLAWFHAVVQERRTYVPQGWSQFYEFSFADLRSGAEIIRYLAHQHDSSLWEALRGLLEYAIYGGRVANPYDLRVLNVYLHQFFDEDVLTGRKPLSDRVAVPSTGDRSDCIRAITSIPERDSPSLFCLPENIERSVQTAASAQLLVQIRSIATNPERMGVFDKEKWGKQLLPLTRLWEKMKENKVLLSAPPSGASATSTSIMNFVQMECRYAHDLVTLVDTQMHEIGRVVRGKSVLTPSLRTITSVLSNGGVPERWQEKWEGAETIDGWMKGICDRTVALSKWYAAAEAGTLLTAPLDMSELFHPERFLNALRQETARQTNCAVDELALTCSWKDDRHPPSPSICAIIAGLLLQGAVFEGGHLAPATSETPNLVPVPPFSLAWAKKEKEEIHRRETHFSVPVYLTTDREVLLTEVEMPFQGDLHHWLLSGVSAFLHERM